MGAQKDPLEPRLEPEIALWRKYQGKMEHIVGKIVEMNVSIRQKQQVNEIPSPVPFATSLRPMNIHSVSYYN